jgi:hypothetical protein
VKNISQMGDIWIFLTHGCRLLRWALSNRNQALYCASVRCLLIRQENTNSFFPSIPAKTLEWMGAYEQY